MDKVADNNKTIKARKPELMVIDKVAYKCNIINVAVAGDSRIVKRRRQTGSTET